MGPKKISAPLAVANAPHAAKMVPWRPLRPAALLGVRWGRVVGQGDSRRFFPSLPQAPYKPGWRTCHSLAPRHPRSPAAKTPPAASSARCPRQSSGKYRWDRVHMCGARPWIRNGIAPTSPLRHQKSHHSGVPPGPSSLTACLVRWWGYISSGGLPHARRSAPLLSR